MATPRPHARRRAPSQARKLGGRLLRLTVWGGLLAIIVGSSAGSWILHRYGQDLPDLEAFEHWDPPRATRIWSADGWLLAQLASERRSPVRPEQIPRHVLAAVVAGEDEHFFQHPGVDPWAILRAAAANLRAGRVVQGGSTLTQQLAKSLLGSERTLERKLRELLLALQIEEQFSKPRIAWLYLNQVYFGRGAYGVDEAARAYFGKGVERVSVSEAAFLAGLPQRPSILARDPEEAERRRRYVLNRMKSAGWLSAEEHLRALQTPPRFANLHNPTATRAPYAAEAVRRWLIDRYGQTEVYRGGLEVWTTIHLDATREARTALEQAARSLDQRQGYRGPLAQQFLAKSAAAETLEQRWIKRFGHEPLPPGRLVPARVETVQAEAAELRLGTEIAQLRLADAQWMVPYDAEAQENKGRLDDLRKALSVGDILLVETGEAKVEGPRRVIARPRASNQAALVAMEPGSGAIRAYIAGRDSDSSQFDRLQQACRQPGSLFKPIVYSAAIHHGLTAATLLNDAPYRGAYQGGGLYYRPGNFDRSFGGQITLSRAFARSRNTPSIELLKRVGIPRAIAWARKLGIRSKLDPVEGLVLGGSCVKPINMARAYATIANGGWLPSPHIVRRVTRHDGVILFDVSNPADIDLLATEAMDRAMDLAKQTPRPRVMPEPEAWVTSALMRDVVRAGTARPAAKWAWPAAGKTGTTDRFDAWFAGFTARLVTLAWVGPDTNERSLGKDETGAEVVLPAWLQFMKSAHSAYEPVDPWEKPPAGAQYVAIDPRTGLKSGRGGRAHAMPFLEGTAPRRVSDPSSALGEDAPDRAGLDF